jgi:transducin (beta)-like 1
MQESGFTHSAFTFAHESMLGRTGLRSADKTLPPGALITFLQKGLQYVGIEESLQVVELRGRKGILTTEGATEMTLLCPTAITSITRNYPPITLNVPPATAAAAIKARLEAEAKLQSQQHPMNDINGPRTGATDHASLLDRQSLAAQAAAAMSQIQQQKMMARKPIADSLNILPKRSESDSMVLQLQAYKGNKDEQTQQQGKRSASGTTKRVPKKQKKQKLQHTEQRRTSLGSTDAPKVDPMDVDDTNDEPSRPAVTAAAHTKTTGPLPVSLPQNGEKENGDQHAVAAELDDVETAARSEEVLQLQMHESEVFMCAWNPVFTTMIATGSGDASARIWEMAGDDASAGLLQVKLLPHGTDPRDKKNKDVTTLEWSSNGQLLATGSYDGVARVWNRNGDLVYTLRKHNGPIFSLKWNKKGNYLLSGSYDTTAIVWDVSEPKVDPVVQQFTEHEAPALDVDWKDDNCFASCSTDKTVHIYRIGQGIPLKIYRGHTDEVNAVKWDPSGTYLASCSDDCTAKVWEVGSDRSGPLYDFTSHRQEIYTVKWSPTGPGSSNPLKDSVLATASFDGTVRLWSISDGSCMRIFNRHRDSVYSVAFSPSGDYLASGALAGQMYIWDIAKGCHVKSYKGKGDIFEVAWNKEETRVAACFSSNVVAVIDFDAKLTIDDNQ